ncbi:hypothetical protein ABDD95_12005 [Mucilaginibacter sp. PAMB04274]|uniref:hypothetical protein n=1 Tax=Mucilaginibacter sp. PAMB04274 TaxID=3138568 RepID=UPI0031F62315
MEYKVSKTITKTGIAGTLNGAVSFESKPGMALNNKRVTRKRSQQVPANKWTIGNLNTNALSPKS